jgi:hypothetical protein
LKPPQRLAAHVAPGETSSGHLCRHSGALSAKSFTSVRPAVKLLKRRVRGPGSSRPREENILISIGWICNAGGCIFSQHTSGSGCGPFDFSVPQSYPHSCTIRPHALAVPPFADFPFCRALIVERNVAR